MINLFNSFFINFGKVRFPPDPNGFLHIGHIFSILINYNFSLKKKINFLIRFDNSNQSKNNIFFYKFILFDLIWLGIKWHKIHYLLNDIKRFKKFFFFFIKKKKIFFKKKNFFLRINLNYLRYFNLINIFNLFFFKKKQLIYLIKKKIIFRKKKKKKHNDFYPTYDFSQCLNDFLNKINVSICTTEFIKNSKIYNFLLKKIKKKPIQLEFEKKKFKYIKISKKKLKKYFLNIFYFRKINITIKSINNFCNNIGVSKKISFIKYLNIIKSIKIEKKFFFVKCNLFINSLLINCKKIIFFYFFLNKNNLNLNNINISINMNIKNNININNFIVIKNILLFKKKIFFKKYLKYNNYILILKLLKKKKIIIFFKKKRHCLYDNKLIFNKNFIN